MLGNSLPFVVKNASVRLIFVVKIVKFHEKFIVIFVFLCYTAYITMEVIQCIEWPSINYSNGNKANTASL